MNNASVFTSKRKHSITKHRIENVLWYISECYLLLVKDGKPCSKSYVKTNTTIPFEDYLRFRLVEDYLVKNKVLLKNRISGLDEINFTAESQKEYIDIKDRKQKPDKIDIFINRLGLNNIWGAYDEEIYFAVECKRIKGISDTSQYIGDIAKFTNRDYIGFRLPFEGQLGFVETSIPHLDITNRINEKLQKENNIITDMVLNPCMLNPNVTSTYISKHKRNTDNKEPFFIYHLFLDYSNIVVD